MSTPKQRQGETGGDDLDQDRFNAARYIGPVSLGVAGGGFLLLEGLIATGIWQGAAAQVVLTGFEAATVGGLADWYAVSALFHRLGPHSDILRRKRPQIERTIIDLVQKKWLARDSLQEFIGKLQPSQFLMRWMERPGHSSVVAQVIRQGLNRMTMELDSPELAGVLERVVREQLGRVDLGPQLGRWLKRCLEQGHHAELWNNLLDALAREARAPETGVLIAKLLRTAVHGSLPVLLAQLERPELEQYIKRHLNETLHAYDLSGALGAWILRITQNGGHQVILDVLLDQFGGDRDASPEVIDTVDRAFRKALRRYAESHPVFGFMVSGLANILFDRSDLEAAFNAAKRDIIQGMRVDPNHPLRKEFDLLLRQTGEKLQNRDPAMVEAVTNLKNKIVERADWTSLIRHTLAWVKETVQSEAAAEGPGLRLLDYEALAKVIAGLLGDLADEVRADPHHAWRERLDSLVQQFVDKLAQNDPDACATVERLKTRFLESADLRGVIVLVLEGAKTELARQLQEPQSLVMRSVAGLIGKFVGELRDKPGQAALIDEWLRDACLSFAESHHDKIGEIVQNNLRKMDDKAFIGHIRDNAWNDLQFIRLNGAVVGFIVGCALGLIGLLFGR